MYPEADYRRAWQVALYPSLGFVVLSLPVVMLLALFTASRISRRISRLQDQVGRIAQGDFRQLTLSQRDDEIRALGDAVNRMAMMLALRGGSPPDRAHATLALLGGGIAHQLRNAATGCNMALDLPAEECPLGQSCESLTVARRQLQQQLNQLVINLLLNAVEAAALGKARHGTPASVSLDLAMPVPGRLLLTVADSGPGPAGHLQDHLFEAFVTEKPDGVGLGLSVARQIAEGHGGSIRWSRSATMTSFVVELPCQLEEVPCA